VSALDLAIAGMGFGGALLAAVPALLLGDDMLHLSQLLTRTDAASREAARDMAADLKKRTAWSRPAVLTGVLLVLASQGLHLFGVLS